MLQFLFMLQVCCSIEKRKSFHSAGQDELSLGEQRTVRVNQREEVGSERFRSRKQQWNFSTVACDLPEVFILYSVF